MLAKTKRLTRTEFAKHFKAGVRTHSPIATVIVSPHETFHGAVVVSKKVSKKAVTRNKIRRRAYAQLYAASRKTQKNVYIILIKPAIMELSKAQQHKEMTALIARVL